MTAVSTNDGSQYQWRQSVPMTAEYRLSRLRSSQTTSYLYIRHIQSVWNIVMLSQRHIFAPLHRYTGQVAPWFGDSGSLEEWKWCHNIMVEADIHFRPLYISVLDLGHWYAVSRAHGCTLTPLHWQTCPLIWGFRFTWGVGMMPQCHGWGWYSPETTSFIHIRHIQSVWDIGMLSQGHMVAPLYRYTGQVAPRFGGSGLLEQWEWCYNVMVEADLHLRPLHTSIFNI